MLAWLSVWSEVQTCIWPSRCHFHSLCLASVKSRLVLPFWYWLTQVVPDKGPLNGCMYVCKELTWCFILKPHLVSCCSCDPVVFWVKCIWQNGARRTNCYWLHQTTLQVESGRQLISDFACVVFAELYLFYDMVILSLSTHAARLFVSFWRSCLLWLTRSLFWFAKFFCYSRF